MIELGKRRYYLGNSIEKLEPIKKHKKTKNGVKKNHSVEKAKQLY